MASPPRPCVYELWSESLRRVVGTSFADHGLPILVPFRKISRCNLLETVPFAVSRQVPTRLVGGSACSKRIIASFCRETRKSLRDRRFRAAMRYRKQGLRLVFPG